MNRTWWMKLALLLIFLVTSVIYVVPTLFNLNPEHTRWPFKQKINLGLDLQGGLYLVLGVDFNKVFKDVADRQSTALQTDLKEKGFTVSKLSVKTDGVPADDPRVVLDFDGTKGQELRDLIKKNYTMLRLTGEQPKQLEFGLSREYKQDVRDKTINQSIEVIRNRIDEFGVSEPAIASQGSDRVTVELPGVKEVQRAKDLIGRTAKLEFKMADDKSMNPQQLSELIAKIEKDNGFAYKEGDKFSEYVAKLNQLAKTKVPEGREIAFERIEREPGATGEMGRVPYLLFSKAEVTGDELQDAQVVFDQENNQPQVSFTLSPKGADLFDKVTAANVGHRLAIVLDNIIHSAPVINGRIPGGRGVITLGRGANYDKIMKEAKDLAIVLRAGALPAQLEFLEQRIVGPSLGADSIAKGAKAGLIGCLLVFVFMIFYYRMSGVIATVSLIFNAVFLIAILIGLDATLTLPGMAGIALTIGMAVDSNVIIFERIRDELEEGKGVTSAIQAGFQKAFTAIFDANITHGIIAIILMSYGTGAIRGFAVTLIVGIFTTLFCAVTVCKLFFDGYISMHSGHEPKKLSI